LKAAAIPRRDMLQIAAAVAAAAGTGALPLRASAAPSRRALVLSGGGSHGAYEAGVIAGLVQSGQLDSYDLVCGTSIGTLNAMMVATGQGPSVRQLWSSIAALNILRPKPQFAAFDNSRSAVARGIAALRFLYGSVRGTVTGFIDSSPLHQLIATKVTAPGGSIRPFVRPLLWTTTDLMSACGVGFMRPAIAPLAGRSLPTLADMASASDGQPPVSLVADRDLVAALLASTAIPGAFDTVTLPGRPGTYVDGGVLDNSPLHLAQYAGATEIDLVLLIRPVTGQQAFRNALAIVEDSFAIMRQRILNDGILLALLQSDPNVRAAIRTAIGSSPLRDQVPVSFHDLFRTDQVPVNIRVIVPSQNLAGSGLVANDQSVIDWNVALGYADFMRSGFQPISQPLDSCRSS
jgi:predicted acylesterase/phospholipase RssA